MALILVQSGLTPMGQFDGLDSQATSMKGGEVCTFTSVTIGTSDQEAADVEDGYVGTTTKARVAITTTVAALTKPIFLTDEGTTGYGTLFGQVVGANVGQSTSGSALGPHTASGPGKITIYAQPGFYATTLDAVDTDASIGLSPTNATLAPNAALSYTTAGKLTPAAGANAVHASNSNVARLVEFSSNGSLVTTPVNLVAALNSPSGSVASSQANRFTMAVYWFAGTTA